MERGDLNRPTRPHLHLASAPSCPDTPVGRFAQDAAGLTVAQVDTGVNDRRKIGGQRWPRMVNNTRYDPETGTRPNWRESTTPGASGLSERASNVAASPVPRTSPTRLTSHLDGSVGSGNTRSCPCRRAPPRIASSPSPGFNDGRIESSTTANRRSGQCRCPWFPPILEG